MIYALHGNILLISYKVAALVLPQNVLIQSFEYFVIPIIIVFVCVLLADILHKYLPKLYHILNGSR